MAPDAHAHPLVPGGKNGAVACARLRLLLTPGLGVYCSAPLNDVLCLHSP